MKNRDFKQGDLVLLYVPSGPVSFIPVIFMKDLSKEERFLENLCEVMDPEDGEIETVSLKRIINAEDY